MLNHASLGIGNKNNNTNNNNLLHLYSAFLGNQSALHRRGVISSTTTSVQHPPEWCDGSHSAPECPPHTSLLVERRRSDEANQSMGMIRRPWWSEANGEIWPGCRGVTPLLFFLKYILGFLMTTVCQDLSLTSHPKDGAFWQYSVCPHHYSGVLGPTQTAGWAPPAGLTNISSSSNLVFTGGLPSRYWPAQTCLASVGNRSWAAGWYGCC